METSLNSGYYYVVIRIFLYKCKLLHSNKILYHVVTRLPSEIYLSADPRLISFSLCHNLLRRYRCSLKHHISFMGWTQSSKGSAYWFLAWRSRPLLFHTFSGKPKFQHSIDLCWRFWCVARGYPSACGHPST